MNIKAIVGIVVLLVLVAGGWWIMAHPPETVPPQQIADPLNGTATTTADGPALEHYESAQYYTIDVVYPNTGNAAAQAAIEAALQSEISDYTNNVSGLDPTIMPSLQQGYKLALDIDYKRYSSTGSLQGPTTSYFFTIFSDTGGAHPNTYFKTFVFDQQGRELKLADLLGNNPQWLEELSLNVSNSVTDQAKQRLGQDDVTGALFAEGLAPKEENFQDFLIDGSDLVIEIPPYQVAAYAMGSFEVRLPLSTMDH